MYTDHHVGPVSGHGCAWCALHCVERSMTRMECAVLAQPRIGVFHMVFGVSRVERACDRGM